jgi:hypothetical protein
MEKDSKLTIQNNDENIIQANDQLHRMNLQLNNTELRMDVR